MKRAIAALWLYSSAVAAMAGPENPGCNFIERKKHIVKAFDVRPDETLSIDNQYGDVKIQLWDKPSVRIDVTITANAPTESRVNDALNSVTIGENRGGRNITIQTAIVSGGQRNNWGNKTGENSLRIDYLVQMPGHIPLNLKNSFGNTDIARFAAPLTVKTRHGNFRAEDLASKINDIVVLYGNAVIGEMCMGKLESEHAKVNLEKVNAIEVKNKFGSLNIGEVGSLKADIGYSGAKIGTLTGNGTVKLSYSDGFSITHSTAENLDIVGAYSPIVIPAQQPAKFDISVTYGDFNFPSNTAISIISKTGNRNTKQYEGNIGSKTPISTIKVVSQYGNVRLKD